MLVSHSSKRKMQGCLRNSPANENQLQGFVIQEVTDMRESW